MKNLKITARMSTIALGLLALTNLTTQAMQKPTPQEARRMLANCQDVDHNKKYMFATFKYALPFHMVCMPIFKTMKEISGEQVALAVVFDQLLATEKGIEIAMSTNDQDLLKRSITARTYTEEKLSSFGLKDLVNKEHRILSTYHDTKNYCHEIAKNSEKRNAAKHGKEFAEICTPFFDQFKDSLKSIENNNSYTGLPTFSKAIMGNEDNLNIVSTVGEVVKTELTINEALKKRNSAEIQAKTGYLQSLFNTLKSLGYESTTK